MKKTNGFILIESLLAMALMVSCLVFLFKLAVQVHVSYQEMKQREMELFSSWLG